jgi:hypothetical protein
MKSVLDNLQERREEVKSHTKMKQSNHHAKKNNNNTKRKFNNLA